MGGQSSAAALRNSRAKDSDFKGDELGSDIDCSVENQKTDEDTCKEHFKISKDAAGTRLHEATAPVPQAAAVGSGEVNFDFHPVVGAEPTEVPAREEHSVGHHLATNASVVDSKSTEPQVEGPSLSAPPSEGDAKTDTSTSGMCDSAGELAVPKGICYSAGDLANPKDDDTATAAVVRDPERIASAAVGTKQQWSEQSPNETIGAKAKAADAPEQNQNHEEETQSKDEFIGGRSSFTEAVSPRREAATSVEKNGQEELASESNRRCPDTAVGGEHKRAKANATEAPKVLGKVVLKANTFLFLEDPCG